MAVGGGLRNTKPIVSQIDKLEDICNLLPAHILYACSSEDEAVTVFTARNTGNPKPRNTVASKQFICQGANFRLEARKKLGLHPHFIR